MTHTTLLDEVLEAWAWTRAGVADEVRNIGEKEMAFRPTPETRSVAELAQHIVETSLMMCGELTRPDGSFRRKSFARLIEEYAGSRVRRATTKKKLMLLLERSRADGERKLRAAGELFLLQPITRFDGKQGTRLAWLNHGITHEEYHRGQLALYARLLGRVPALTQRIEG